MVSVLYLLQMGQILYTTEMRVLFLHIYSLKSEIMIITINQYWLQQLNGGTLVKSQRI